MIQLGGFFSRAQPRRGHLVLIGGAEERSGRMAVLRHVLGLHPGRRVAVIPAASEYPRELGDTYTRSFQDLGAQEVHILDVRGDADVRDPEHLARAAASDLIFFTGGDQVRLVEILRASPLLDLIRTRSREGATVAGTSAGAAAASDPMIFDGDYEGHRKGTVSHGEGFGFLPGVTVDTHFTERHRLPRLVQFLCSGLSRRGIGLGEDTALVLPPEGPGTVVGSGVVTTVEASALDFCSYPETTEGGLFGVEGLRIGFLPAGAQFDLQRWSVRAGEPEPAAGGLT